MRLHTWGAEFGTRSVVWWDVWARAFCWQVVESAGGITVTFTPDEAAALHEVAGFALGMVGVADLAADLDAALVKLDASITARQQLTSRGSR